MAADNGSAELPTVMEGKVYSRMIQRFRETSLIANSGKMAKGSSLPDLSRDRPSSPLPCSSIGRLAVPCSLGPNRSCHPTAFKTSETRKHPNSSFRLAAMSPVITRKRTRAFSESSKQELLSPVFSQRVLASTVLSPVQIQKDFVSRANPCPTSPRLSPTKNGREFTKSRPATPCILSSSPSLFTPGNRNRLPRITQSHSPRPVRPLSPIRMPLDSTRGLFNISPVSRARASDSDSEDSDDSCCDLQEKVSGFLQSITLAEVQEKIEQ